jgi:hypothetical protein
VTGEQLQKEDTIRCPDSVPEPSGADRTPHTESRLRR